MRSDTRRAAQRRGLAIVGAAATTLLLTAAPTYAHGGAAYCTADLKQVGATYENHCLMPFQGFPIGITGVYDSEPGAVERTGTKPAKIHLELMAKVAVGPPRPIGVECEETTTGVARCTTDYNPLLTPLAGPEPAPSEIVGIWCAGHSHASFSRSAPPAGRFACWSTDESREHLAHEGWFEEPATAARERPATKRAAPKRRSNAQTRQALRRLAGRHGRVERSMLRGLSKSRSSATKRRSSEPAAGTAYCTGDLKQVGATYENHCLLPFQGFPIGVAGVFDSEPGTESPTGDRPAEVHVELMAKLAAGPPRPISVECRETTTGVARCTTEYNPLGTPLSAPQPAPSEIVGLWCAGHSHASFRRTEPPAGRFACWSTDESRKTLDDQGWFADAGFDPASGGSATPPALGGLSDLSALGATGQITTVPFNTYAPSTVVVSRSLGLTYTNLDTARHDVVARDAKRPDGSAPWCANFEDPEDPDARDCPLFWSELIPGGGTQTPVLGLRETEPGDNYTFYCSIHPYMTGTIEVVE